MATMRTRSGADHGMPATTKQVTARNKSAQSRTTTNLPGVISSADDVLALQRLVGNRAVGSLLSSPVNRLLDGFYLPEKKKVPRSSIALTAAFKKKHVAENEDGAKKITSARIAEGKPQGMVNGSLGNTTAKEADWMAAIDDSEALMPDDAAWKGRLPIKLTGWDAKRSATGINLTPLADAARTIGGYMNKSGGQVQVDHVAGQ